MIDEKVKSKLAKRAKKLVAYARKHGLDYINISVMAPDEDCPRWFADVEFTPKDYRRVSVTQFYDEGSDDE